MSEPRIELNRFPSREQADQALAAEVIQILEQAIATRGRASLVVSGGSTPLRFFGLLSHSHLAWSKVTLTLADDRMVDAAHSDSNARLVREHLMLNDAASARFLPLFGGSNSPSAEVNSCDQMIALLGPTDAVVLGMGGDGHTASLFPSTPALAKGLDMNSGRCCIGVTPPVAPYYRLSQTLPALLNTQRVFLHFFGKDKMAVLQDAQDRYQPDCYPISAVMHQDRVPVSVYYAD